LNVSNDEILIEDVMDAHSTIQDYMNRNHAIKKTTKTFLVSQIARAKKLQVRLNKR